MLRLFFLTAFLCLTATNGNADEERIYTFGTLHFPPYEILNEDQSISGFDVDVLREAFRRMGKKLTVEISPWRRALQKAQSGVWDGVLSCSPREEFYQSDPISTATDALFVPADHNFETHPIEKIEDLLKYPDLKVGGVAGYRQLKLLDKHDIPYDVSPDDATAFKKLFSGRIDVMISIQEFGKYTLKRLELPPLIKVIPIRMKEYHICFSKVPDGASELITQFNNALAEIRRDGTFDAIHAKYK